MRVIAGALKGRRLNAPDWEGVRPTSDKLRETLFNVIGPRIDGARVLDGFAGTGAIGIEAISRGAVQVTFIDQDRRALALIRDNLAHSGAGTGYTVVGGDVVRTVTALPSADRFDIILLDPPYDAADLQAIVETAGDRLEPGGLLALEHARRREAPREAGRLVRVRDLTAGDSALAFYNVRT
jgi:16S rRNA (guanine(966)-N(2))-methyltransferase RsmD